jgi:hypothetical protein
MEVNLSAIDEELKDIKFNKNKSNDNSSEEGDYT